MDKQRTEIVRETLENQFIMNRDSEDDIHWKQNIENKYNTVFCQNKNKKTLTNQQKEIQKEILKLKPKEARVVKKLTNKQIKKTPPEYPQFITNLTKGIPTSKTFHPNGSTQLKSFS